MWYPGLMDYLQQHDRKAALRSAYFSIGETESKTRNPVLQTGRDCTEQIAQAYRQAGIPSTFELNPGNHFQDPELRLAKGICQVLKLTD